MPVYLLGKPCLFPPVEQAEPEGVLAVGGDLSVKRLLRAYRSGIFPWYSEGEPLLWWSPDPRFVLFPSRLNVSASMRRTLKKGRFAATYDRDFRGVMTRCAAVPRKGQTGTWITREMLEAYCALHAQGYAHSVEVWADGRLAGGLYGVSLGACFFGESMFTAVPDASKFALITLVRDLERKGFTIIDSQVYTAHLASLGAEEVPRGQYLRLLREALRKRTLRGHWGETFGEAAN